MHIDYYSMIEKIYNPMALEYESINDRINRLRKKASLNKPKERSNTLPIQ